MFSGHAWRTARLSCNTQCCEQVAAKTIEAACVGAGQSGNNPLEEAVGVEVCGILGSELIHISGGHLRERQTIRLSGPFPGL